MGPRTTIYATAILIPLVLIFYLPSWAPQETFTTRVIIYLLLPIGIGWTLMHLLIAIFDGNFTEEDLSDVSAVGCIGIGFAGWVAITVLVIALIPFANRAGAGFGDAFAALTIYGVIRELIPTSPRFWPGWLVAVILRGLCYVGCYQLMDSPLLQRSVLVVMAAETALAGIAAISRRDITLLFALHSIGAWLVPIRVGIPEARAAGLDGEEQVGAIVITSILTGIVVLAVQGTQLLSRFDD